MKKNVFIALEGIDGSGKSTQARLLAENMQKYGLRAVVTSEPTSGPIGQLIRSILQGNMPADHRTVAALFVADRLEHLLDKEQGILKMLASGYSVISDRYYFSSYAYQGSHASLDWVIAANSACADLLRPDLNVFIDVSPEISLKRLAASRNALDIYETSGNLERVREKYLEAFDRMQSEEQIFITDGNRPPDMIAADIWKEVARLVQSQTIT
ncbi:MAG: dTMP kinase [Chitinophagales bacterium]|nr:MAG: dTMP kinase [Chitinophagales bacterium]